MRHKNEKEIRKEIKDLEIKSQKTTEELNQIISTKIPVKISYRQKKLDEIEINFNPSRKMQEKE